MQAICAGFETAPESCSGLGPRQKQTDIAFEVESSFTLSTGAFTGIIIALIIVNIIFLYCYRRHSKREMHSDMQVQIESAVSQYYALS